VNYSLAGTGSVYMDTENKAVTRKQDDNQKEMEESFDELSNGTATLATVFHKNRSDIEDE